MADTLAPLDRRPLPPTARLLAVIPARGGSKRLPGKNIRPLGGKPLIAWTLDAARDSGVFAHVLVSTDDEAIAEAARRCGADVPWLRPAELASDTASSAHVLRHALSWYEGKHGPVYAVVLLQPTSPFRSPASIRGAVASYLAQSEAQRHAVVSVSPAPQHPAWCFRLESTGMQPFLGWEMLLQRSQDLPPAYALNGAVYVLPPQAIRDGAPLICPGTQPFVMTDPREALDIDNDDDWRRAEQLATP